VLGIIGIAKGGTLSAETVGLGSILRVAPFARCANSWLSLTNDRPGLLGAAARGLALGICETVMPIPGCYDYLFRHVRELFA